MRIVYLGSDVPSNRGILEEAGVQNVGFSFWRAFKRGLPKNKSFSLAERFNESMNIYVYSGHPKEDSTEIPADYFKMYAQFIDDNYERITLIYEDEEIPNKPEWSGKIIKIWDAETGKKGLEYLADLGIQNIGILGQDIETNYFLAATTQTLSQQGVSFHAIAAAKPDNLRQVKVATASTMAWLSPMMRGETIVWDGNRIVRYNKSMREQARPRYTHIYEKAGLSFDKILADDEKEVSKLALWSYSQFEKRVSMTDIYDMSENISGAEIAETTPDNADRKGVQMRKIVPRSEEEMGALPVFGYNLETVIEDDGTIKELPIVQSQSGSLRQCNTCFVASNCPAYKQDSMCAFKLPVEVKTKEQLKALINAIVEMQGQRVAFARFSEELNGGYPDPNVSQEIDRLFKLFKTVKDLDDSQSFIRMTVESKASSGVLSALFGDRAANLKELPNGGLDETQTTKIIHQITEE